MTEESEHLPQVPLESAYPFNTPGEGIPLYSGPVGLADHEVAGQVALRCAPKLDITWQLDDSQLPWEDLDLELSPVDLRVPHLTGERVLIGNRRGLTHGWLDGVSLGSETVSLTRALVHWMNLPAIDSPVRLVQGEGSDQRQWRGRWPAIIGNWALKLDRRPDHKDIWNALHEEQSIAMTHVMEITRVDGQAFTAIDVKPLLHALQFGLSFALGRWAAPSLPVGFDADGHRVWEEWAPWLCEPGSSGALAWWYYERTNDLGTLLRAVDAAFTDPDRVDSIRLLLSMAVQSNSAGFVEQRLMTAFSGIEHLSWIILKLGGGMSVSSYKALFASGRLRRLLDDAHVSTAIDAELQPALAQFAGDESAADESLDGPTAVALVRNRLVHPKAPQDEVYHIKGLVKDTWLLTRHYLNLLILHWLGYTGSYQTVLGPGGWAGDVKTVPWAETVTELNEPSSS